MKVLLILLTLILFSSLSLAETIYVRKSIVSDGVTEQDGSKAREVIRTAVKEDGHKIMGTAGQASFSLRALINKTADGKFLVKIEKKHGSKVIEAGEATDENIEMATHGAVITSLATFNAPSIEPTEHTVNREASSSSSPQGTDASPVCSQDIKKLNYIKNWSIALGPVLSNNLTGTNGTKFAVTFAYNLALNEHFDAHFLVDTNLNTASMGGTAVQVFGVGGTYFLNDRSNDFTPFLMLDVGYGGANRGNDATEEGGASIGVNLFRTQNAAITFYLREFVLLTNNGSNPANYPNVTQLMVGVMF